LIKPAFGRYRYAHMFAGALFHGIIGLLYA